MAVAGKDQQNKNAEAEGRSRRWKALRTTAIVLIAVALTVAFVLIASNTLRLDLPDQGVMEHYLAETPLDALPELHNAEVQRDGENPRLCFMCSVYGVRKSFDLDVVPESERRGFCATVRELVTSWQGETRTAQVEFGGEWCHVIVSSVLGHDDWNLKVFVLFVPDHDNPPFVSVSLHLRRYRQLA